MSDDLRAHRLATLLRDRFEILEFLGHGGFAAVYKARSRSLDRLEAVKVLLANHEDDPEFAGRFQQEARVAASLDHPNIVHIFDFGRAEELFWYSMQFVGGPTLTRELSSGPMDERRAATLLVPVCDALAYVHGKGIVHRDLKPDNVMLGPTGRPVLMDFGIAKAEKSLVKTQSGFVLGSPAFLSPEQLQGEPLDGRSDVYSLGITLYQMLSGKRPFTATDRAALMIMRLREDPVPLEQARGGLDPRLVGLVMRCLSRGRAGRPTAAEMRDELQALLDDWRGLPAPTSGALLRPASTRIEPLDERETAATAALHSYPTAVTVSSATALPAPPLPPPLPPPPPARRSRIPLFAAGVVLAGIAMVAGVVILRPSRNEPTLPARSLTFTPVPTIVPTPAPPTPAPTSVPVPSPTPAAAARLPAPARRAPESERAPEPAPAARRPVVPAEILEQTPVKLPPDVATEYAGKTTGLKVTVGEDGALKSTRIAIPVDPPCAACDAAALEAVKRFRFAPAKDREGRPVESSFGVAVRF